MTIVPMASELEATALAVPLARYAHLVGYNECPFWGVNHAATEYACRTIWLKSQRDEVARALASAQAMIEEELGYPLGTQWFEDEVHDYRARLLTREGMVTAVGVLAETDIALAEAVDHTADPAVIGPVATTVTDEDEIRVYHPGTEVEIMPSAVTIAGGFVTIAIPRCRLVTEAAADNDENGLDYADTAPGGPFEQTVDVKRLYTDPTTQAELVWRRCSDPPCDETTATACMRVRQATIGAVDIEAATYADGAWTRSVSVCCRGEPDQVRLNYAAGLTPLTRTLEEAVVRLAHALMPDEPCGCDVLQRLWRRDRSIPTVLTRERVNCPFGISDGAWAAWRIVWAQKLVRGGRVA